MLRSLKIENFRCFQNFELQQLGQLNLLVGTNNSGKTSILEAIQILYSQANLEPLRKLMTIRGEYFWREENPSLKHIELDVRHLFYGHKIDEGSSFSISGKKDNNLKYITVFVGNTEKLNADNLSPELRELNELFLDIKCSEEERKIDPLPLSLQKGFPGSYIRYTHYLEHPLAATQFVRSFSLTHDEMIDLFNDIVLTPEEALIIEALQTIEPSIERIAVVNQTKIYNGSHTGFVVRLANSDQRIPIGSMGDGIWRILGLTLAIVSARNGVLLVDEIDTGLHFSAMNDMWKLIWKTAKKLNVQVFATTHNSDCWTSLAAIANTEHPSEEGITIHRIEKGKTNSVVFTERQIVIAAERGIEVR